MFTIKTNETEYKTTLSESELKEAFKTPRNYFEFMEELHKQLGIPFFDEAELWEWVIESEKEDKQ